MKKTIVFLTIILPLIFLSTSCNTAKPTSTVNLPFEEVNNYPLFVTQISNDKDYGYSPKKPVSVGGANKSEGPLNERRYLSALAGPNGEQILFRRLGSCCRFESPNGFGGYGLLDRYEVIWDGQEKPVIIYINMYDYDELYAPIGFTLRSM